MSESHQGPVVLCIMDGIGITTNNAYNAVSSANTPNLDRLMASYPSRTLKAHGTAVGLPSDGDMGNSEVGHNAMGAGRVFAQGAKLVSAAIVSGAAFETPVWKELVQTNTVHLLGLVSDGNVHSHIDHLLALINRAAEDGVQRLRVHVLTDGRDVPPRSALTWVTPLEQTLAHHTANGRDYTIASGGGRMQLTMDRYEADWSMVQRGWRCHVLGEGRPFSSATEAISTFYREDEHRGDQNLPAFVVVKNNAPVGTIEDGHGVLFFNFRGDRALEICRAFTNKEVPFERQQPPEVFFAGMMQYDGDLKIPANYLVDPPLIDRTLGEFLGAAGLRSFCCSETQKFGHVTFFFNGNRSTPHPGETWREIPSDTLPFDERPWMKAAEITDAVIQALKTNTYQHLRLNLANGDMVGHTGNLQATKIAVEAVDLCLGRLERAVLEHNGTLLITADHGNADEMAMTDKKTGTLKHSALGAVIKKTSHTLNPVPFILVQSQPKFTLEEEGDLGLASIAGTILTLCGVQPPSDYVRSLIK